MALPIHHPYTMDCKSTPLASLYQKLNPRHQHNVDGCELRADSRSKGLRVKTGSSFFSSESTRTAHRAYAKAKVQMILDSSIRQRLDLGGAQDVSSIFNSIWSRVVGDSPSITVRAIRQLDEAVNKLQPQSMATGRPETGRSETRPTRPSPPLQASPGRRPLAEKTLPSSHAEVHVNSALFLTPAPRSTPVSQPAGAENMSVRLHGAASTGSPWAMHMGAHLATLQREFSRERMTKFTEHELCKFHADLSVLLKFTARHAPELLLTDGAVSPWVLSAADRMSKFPGLLPDAALLMATRFVSPAMASSIEPHVSKAGFASMSPSATR